MNVARNLLVALVLVLTIGSQIVNAQERTLPDACDCKQALGIGGADYESVLRWDCDFMVRELCGIFEYDASCAYFSSVGKSLSWPVIERFAQKEHTFYAWWYGCKMKCIEEHTSCKVPKTCHR